MSKPDGISKRALAASVAGHLFLAATAGSTAIVRDNGSLDNDTVHNSADSLPSSSTQFEAVREEARSYVQKVIGLYFPENVGPDLGQTIVPEEVYFTIDAYVHTLESLKAGKKYKTVDEVRGSVQAEVTQSMHDYRARLDALIQRTPNQWTGNILEDFNTLHREIYVDDRFFGDGSGDPLRYYYLSTSNSVEFATETMNCWGARHSPSVLLDVYQRAGVPLNDLIHVGALAWGAGHMENVYKNSDYTTPYMLQTQGKGDNFVYEGLSFKGAQHLPGIPLPANDHLRKYLSVTENPIFHEIVEEDQMARMNGWMETWVLQHYGNEQATEYRNLESNGVGGISNRALPFNGELSMMGTVDVDHAISTPTIDSESTSLSAEEAKEVRKKAIADFLTKQVDQIFFYYPSTPDYYPSTSDGVNLYLPSWPASSVVMEYLNGFLDKKIKKIEEGDGGASIDLLITYSILQKLQAYYFEPETKENLDVSIQKIKKALVNPLALKNALNFDSLNDTNYFSVMDFAADTENPELLNVLLRDFHFDPRRLFDGYFSSLTSAETGESWEIFLGRHVWIQRLSEDAQVFLKREFEQVARERNALIQNSNFKSLLNCSECTLTLEQARAMIRNINSEDWDGYMERLISNPSDADVQQVLQDLFLHWLSFQKARVAFLERVTAEELARLFENYLILKKAYSSEYLAAILRPKLAEFSEETLKRIAPKMDWQTRAILVMWSRQPKVQNILINGEVEELQRLKAAPPDEYGSVPATIGFAEHIDFLKAVMNQSEEQFIASVDLSKFAFAADEISALPHDCAARVLNGLLQRYDQSKDWDSRLRVISLIFNLKLTPPPFERFREEDRVRISQESWVDPAKAFYLMGTVSAPMLMERWGQFDLAGDIPLEVLLRLSHELEAI